MKMTDKQIEQIVILAKIGIATGAAILEDYATRMAKLQGITSSEIMEDVRNLTKKKFDDLKNENSEPLPTLHINKPKKTSDVRIPYAIYICSKLSIPWNVRNFNLEKIFDDIAAKNLNVSVAMLDYFATFAEYKICYVKLKRTGAETIENYYLLEKNTENKKKVLDGILKKIKAFSPSAQKRK